MANLSDTTYDTAKILLVGDQGHGKTGAKAALVALGYKLRMIDTDRGFKILKSLLTDERYPYAAYMKRHGIDPYEPGRISYIPIDVPMGFNNVSVKKKSGNVTYQILAPTSAMAWATVVKQLQEWKDGDQNFGSYTDWDDDVVLDFDTLSTLAELAKYWNQDLNNRLGALEDDHGRDTGAAQELVTRLMMALTSPKVRCNVIVTTHITWADVSRGAALSPEQLLRDNKSVDSRGFPSVIGRALSPVLGKRWNDMLIVRRTGNTAEAERKIYTTPIDNTDAKHSVWLDDSYPLSTGLAEIFCALQYKEPPHELIKAVRGNSTDPKTTGTAKGFGQ